MNERPRAGVEPAGPAMASGGPGADRPAPGNPHRRDAPGPERLRHAHGGAGSPGSLRSGKGAPRRGAAHIV